MELWQHAIAEDLAPSLSNKVSDNTEIGFLYVHNSIARKWSVQKSSRTEYFNEC